jgi:hypothetical protein
MTGQDWFNLASVIGAAAWAIPIISYFLTPSIRVVIARAVEVGYTTTGPVLNVTAAFKTSRKDALLTGIGLKLVHETGTSMNFECTSLDEQTGAAIGSGNQRTLYLRSQTAIALALNVNALPERKLIFQEKYSAAIGRVDKVADHNRRKGGDRWLADTMESVEFRDQLDLVGAQFVWQQGSYICTVVVDVEELREPVSHAFSFSLSQADVDLLRGNIGMFHGEAKRAYTGSGEPARWAWVNPRTNRIAN